VRFWKPLHQWRNKKDATIAKTTQSKSENKKAAVSVMRIKKVL
jgi:hypothetical protein